MGGGREHAAERSFHHGDRQSRIKKEDIRYLFAGDLLGQTMATSFGVLDFQVPLFGLYGACSTCGESLSLGAMCVAAGYADHVVTMTSSHFASAEKQFRFPLEYANQRPKSATWTVTGSAAFVLGKERGMAKSQGSQPENCGFWDQRFHEYGGSHGTCSQRGHQTAF